MIATERIVFQAEPHAYTLDGSDVPSITTVLECEGLSGNGNGYWKEEHRQRGTAVHRVCLLLGKRPWRGKTAGEIIENSLWDPLTTHPTLVPYGFALAQWYVDSGFRPELTERPVASLKFGIAGTLDQWGGMPSGEKVLVDFKSGQPTPAANIQTALYAMLLEETLGLKTDQRVVLWLKPDGTYKAFPPRPAGGMDLAIGQAAVSLYHWRRKAGVLG